MKYSVSDISCKSESIDQALQNFGLFYFGWSTSNMFIKSSAVYCYEAKSNESNDENTQWREVKGLQVEI